MILMSFFVYLFAIQNLFDKHNAFVLGETTFDASVLDYIKRTKNASLNSECVRQAQQWLNPGHDTTNRLAVLILFSYSLVNPLTEFNCRRLSYLHCALTDLYVNLGQTTKLDVYLFVDTSETSVLPAWVTSSFPMLIVLPISTESWQLPDDIKPPQQWKFYPDYSIDYRLQGRWRLQFVPWFVRAMGYSYWLQMDDDTFIVETYPRDIVDQFRRQGSLMGVRRRHYQEGIQVVNGLAELTRYVLCVCRPD
jgi:hypothetical protein